MKKLLIASLLFLAGCYEWAPPQDDLRTVPVTNNPHVLPGVTRPSPLPNM
ncbi:MAG: hypothetical protein JSR58_05650 [Verrucomicrobia bacterium]|nr:hypothetical protein [Verrucomicrobiota bacterium]